MLGLVLALSLVLLSNIAYAKPFTEGFDSVLIKANDFFGKEQYKAYSKTIDFIVFALIFIAIYMRGVKFAFKEINKTEKLLAVILGLTTAFLMVIGDFSIVALLPFVNWFLYFLLFALIWWLLKDMKSKFWRFLLALALTLLLLLLSQLLFSGVLTGLSCPEKALPWLNWLIAILIFILLMFLLKDIKNVFGRFVLALLLTIGIALLIIFLLKSTPIEKKCPEVQSAFAFVDDFTDSLKGIDVGSFSPSTPQFLRDITLRQVVPPSVPSLQQVETPDKKEGKLGKTVGEDGKKSEEVILRSTIEQKTEEERHATALTDNDRALGTIFEVERKVKGTIYDPDVYRWAYYSIGTEEGTKVGANAYKIDGPKERFLLMKNDKNVDSSQLPKLANEIRRRDQEMQSLGTRIGAKITPDMPREERELMTVDTAKKRNIQEGSYYFVGDNFDNLRLKRKTGFFSRDPDIDRSNWNRVVSAPLFTDDKGEIHYLRKGDIVSRIVQGYGPVEYAVDEKDLNWVLRPNKVGEKRISEFANFGKDPGVPPLVTFEQSNFDLTGPGTKDIPAHGFNSLKIGEKNFKSTSAPAAPVAPQPGLITEPRRPSAPAQDPKLRGLEPDIPRSLPGPRSSLPREGKDIKLAGSSSTGWILGLVIAFVAVGIWKRKEIWEHHKNLLNKWKQKRQTIRDILSRIEEVYKKKRELIENLTSSQKRKETLALSHDNLTAYLKKIADEREQGEIYWYEKKEELKEEKGAVGGLNEEERQWIAETRELIKLETEFIRSLREWSTVFGKVNINTEKEHAELEQLIVRAKDSILVLLLRLYGKETQLEQIEEELTAFLKDEKHRGELIREKHKFLEDAKNVTILVEEEGRIIKTVGVKIGEQNKLLAQLASKIREAIQRGISRRGILAGGVAAGLVTGSTALAQEPPPKGLEPTIGNTINE